MHQQIEGHFLRRLVGAFRELVETLALEPRVRTKTRDDQRLRSAAAGDVGLDVGKEPAALVALRPPNHRLIAEHLAHRGTNAPVMLVPLAS